MRKAKPPVDSLKGKQPQKAKNPLTPPLTEDQAANESEGPQTIAVLPTNPDSPITSGTPNRTEIEDVISNWLQTYLSSSAEYPWYIGNIAVPPTIDAAEAEFGIDIYDRMCLEPMLGGAVRLLKILVLADGLAVAPSHPEPKQDATPEEKADYDQSVEISEYIEFVVDRLGKKDRPLTETLWNALDCTYKGHKLAEMTADIIEGGDYDGKMGLAMFRCKPRENYRFVKNAVTNEVIGVIGKVAGGSIALRSGLIGGNAAEISNVIAPEKLVNFTMDDRDGNPQGKSWFRDPYDPWYCKQQAKRVELQALVRFSGGQVAIIMPEADKDVLFQNPVTKAQDTLLNVCIAAGSMMGNGRVTAFPFGTDLKFPGPPTGSASYFDTFMARKDREMLLAFLLGYTAVLEAKHSSKASSETGQDLLDELKMYVRERLCKILTLKVFRWLVECSYGKEIAERFTPEAQMQKASRPDFAANATAVAALIMAMQNNEGWQLTAEQRQYLFVEILGMPAGDEAGEEVDDGAGETPDEDPEETAKNDIAAKAAALVQAATAANPNGPAPSSAKGPTNGKASTKQPSQKGKEGAAQMGGGFPEERVSPVRAAEGFTARRRYFREYRDLVGQDRKGSPRPSRNRTGQAKR